MLTNIVSISDFKNFSHNTTLPSDKKSNGSKEYKMTNMETNASMTSYTLLADDTLAILTLHPTSSNKDAIVAGKKYRDATSLYETVGAVIHRTRKPLVTLTRA